MQRDFTAPYRRLGYAWMNDLSVDDIQGVIAHFIDCQAVYRRLHDAGGRDWSGDIARVNRAAAAWKLALAHRTQNHEIAAIVSPLRLPSQSDDTGDYGTSG